MAIQKHPSLRWEIIVLLVVKLVLIAAIRFAYFSDAIHPDAEATGRHLLHSPQHEETSRE